MPTTSNFGWTTPADTDLVKDGAAAIRTLGNGIDTSLVDLKGGTTGQILSKASNTDLDYTWITNDVGDITAVTAGTGISGGGTSGEVTITNSMATAIDAKGDLVAGTGADAFSRLAVGANDTVLTADSSTSTGLKWATPAAAGGFDLLSTTTLNAASTTINIASGYKTLQVIGDKIYGSANNTSGGCYARLNSDTGSNYCFNFIRFISSAGGPTDGVGTSIGLSERLASTNSLGFWTTFQLNLFAVDGTDTVPFTVISRAHSGTTASFLSSSGTYDNSAIVSSITIISPSGETLNGKIYIYGAK